MSDIIDPQRPVVPASSRDRLVVDETLHQASVDGSALRSSAYRTHEVTYSDNEGPVIVRSTDFELKHRGQLMSVFAMVAIAFISFWMPLSFCASSSVNSTSPRGFFSIDAPGDARLTPFPLIA